MNETDGYLLGSYRIATAPEPNASRSTSFRSIRFDSPANNVGPRPASVGCTTAKEKGIGLFEVLNRVTVQFFVRDA